MNDLGRYQLSLDYDILDVNFEQERVQTLASAPRHACGRKGLNKVQRNITHEMYKKH